MSSEKEISTVDPIDLGDLTVDPDPNGRDLRFTNATQLPTVTLSREGATALWVYLFHWLGMPAEATQHTAPPASWEVCPPLHTQASTLRITET
jgi:hypothetical protein